jgi:hypothetical protein
MHSLRSLAQPARDFVVARLEALHLALHQLAGRLRDNIATLIGSHVGNAVGDVLRASLARRLPETYDDDTDDFYGDHSPYGHHEHEHRWRSWHDADPRERWYGTEQQASLRVSVPLPGWLPLVPPILHTLTWLLGPLIARRAWMGTLAVGGTASLAAVLVRPLAGVLTGSAGVVLLLLYLPDQARDTCNAAAGFLAR